MNNSSSRSYYIVRSYSLGFGGIFLINDVIYHSHSTALNYVNRSLLDNLSLFVIIEIAFSSYRICDLVGNLNYVEFVGLPKRDSWVDFTFPVTLFK